MTTFDTQEFLTRKYYATDFVIIARLSLSALADLSNLTGPINNGQVRQQSDTGGEV